MDPNKVMHFRVPTSVGPVWVTPLRDGQLDIMSRTGSMLAERYNDGTTDELYITVNRVKYDVTAWMRRDDTGTWVPEREFWMRREDYFSGPKRETSVAAERKGSTVLYREVPAWLATDAARPFFRAMARIELADAIRRARKIAAEVADLQGKMRAKEMLLADAQARQDAAACVWNAVRHDV